MSFKYGFYNAELVGEVYDRTYDAEDFSCLFDGLISDGVFKTYGDKFKVTKTGNTSVKVGTGKAWLNGTWNVLDQPKSFTVDGSAPLSAVVLQVSKSSRTNSLYIKKGGNTISLINDDDTGVYQYCLAYIHVNTSTKAITSIESHIGNGSENVTPWAMGLLGGGSSGSSSEGSSSTIIDASAYTTGIRFKGATGFELDFKDENGLTYTNKFTITLDNNKIVKITNKTAGRSIAVSYE